MDTWAQLLVALAALISAVGSAAGFWAYIRHRGSTRTATTKLLMGLGYDKLIKLGVSYIERGWITKDEYEDMRKFLYEPYKALGGNGVAEKIMSDVTSLPLGNYHRYSEISNIHNNLKEERNDDRTSVAQARHAAPDF
jgi:hypothetical protein